MFNFDKAKFIIYSLKSSMLNSRINKIDVLKNNATKSESDWLKYDQETLKFKSWLRTKIMISLKKHKLHATELFKSLENQEKFDLDDFCYLYACKNDVTKLKKCTEDFANYFKLIFRIFK